jgi:hypothetical protein
LRLPRKGCSYNYTVLIGDSCFIYQGAALRVIWMRYQGHFPAREFLEGYPDDFARFLFRVEEIGDTGRITLKKHGHQLKGPYRDLHQFNMELTRSWGFRVDDTYVVLSAGLKRTKGQEPDYDRALALRTDYFTGRNDD